MRTQLLFCLVLLAIAGPLTAQVNLADFNREKAVINKNGFLVLGSWSAANIISGAIGQSVAGGEAKYFHRMNLIWGSVNLLIALPGYLGARKTLAEATLGASIREQYKQEKIFAFNAGLDIAYMAAGAWWLQKAKSSGNMDRDRGYGKSVLMQGGALLLFDAIMFTTHNRHGKKLSKILGTVQLAPNRLGCRILI
jgi:hypothetical protein